MICKTEPGINSVGEDKVAKKQSHHSKRAVVLAAIVLAGIVGCRQDDGTGPVTDPRIDRTPTIEPPIEPPIQPPMETATEVERVVVDTDSLPAEIFTASLMPMNEHLLVASPNAVAFPSAVATPSAEVQLRVQGDTVVIDVNAQGLPAGMMLLQHFHGFADGSAASCPGSDADTNNDGVIDVVEIESSAGITMVPFHDDPASMEMESEAYPITDDQGTFHYNQSVSLNALRGAFQEMFGDNELYLDNRVVFIHGVPENTVLPGSVQSIPGAPARMTVPLACGELSRQ